MYKCEWDECRDRFWSTIDFERHVRNHIDQIEPTDIINTSSTKEVARQGNKSTSHCSPLNNKPIYKTTDFASSSSSIEEPVLKKESFENAVASDSSSHEGLIGRTKRAFRDLAQDVSDQDDVRCILCTSGLERPGNLIVLCDQCDSGYHQQCHRPIISSDIVKDKFSVWFCRKCLSR